MTRDAARPEWTRRGFIAAASTLLVPTSHAEVVYPVVQPGRPLRFPRDHGAHPQYRTEWWYVTGWVRDDRGRELGVQVTFFRNRPGLQEDNPSRFAPRQLLFAHAAIADPAIGRLRHDERAARAGFALAEASDETTRVRIDDWSLDLANGRYRARIRAHDFTVDLTFDAPAQPLLQGDRGYSRKGPQPQQASWYYSRPQLQVRGTIAIDGVGRTVQGRAWLDHEWSSAIMAEQAVGWDWTGLNFDDGSALMAFRMRDGNGAPWWSGGSLQDAAGRVRIVAPGEVAFEPLRRWRSPRTGIEWPVAMRIRVADRSFDLMPLFEDQELDSRGSVGTIYWEGAVRVRSGERTVGSGYLELTGYGQRLKL